MLLLKDNKLGELQTLSSFLGLAYDNVSKLDVSDEKQNIRNKFLKDAKYVFNSLKHTEHRNPVENLDELSTRFDSCLKIIREDLLKKKEIDNLDHAFKKRDYEDNVDLRRLYNKLKRFDIRDFYHNYK